VLRNGHVDEGGCENDGHDHEEGASELLAKEGAQGEGDGGTDVVLGEGAEGDGVGEHVTKEGYEGEGEAMNEEGLVDVNINCDGHSDSWDSNVEVYPLEKVGTQHKSQMIQIMMK